MGAETTEPSYVQVQGQEQTFAPGKALSYDVPEYVAFPDGEEEITQGTNGIHVDMAELFHIIAICCAVLSLFTSNLVELVPVVLWFFFQQHLKAQTQKHINIYRINVCVTACAFAISFLLLLVLGIISFGIGFIFMIFLIPYLIVLFQLFKTNPSTLAAQDIQLSPLPNDIVEESCQV